MLVRLDLMEQRHKAVLEVLGGHPVTQVALRYGVARQTVHEWLRRYAASGVGGLFDRPSRPATCPHQMAPVVEARLVALRVEHADWGPATLLHHLATQGVTPLPGRSSVYRCLLRHHLVERKPRRRRREDYRRWERSRSMELWQMDVMGGVRLTDGTELKLVSGLDDHSRFCVSAKLVRRATARPVCEALAEAMRRHGVPDQVLTDNGKVFTGRFGPGSGEVLFDRILRENGVRHLLTAPHSPTTTGKVERFHKTVRTEFLKDRTFPDLERAQAELDAWVCWYNTERPHQGIGMVAPTRRFELAQPQEPEPIIASLPEEPPLRQRAGEKRLTRVVQAQGSITLADVHYHVGSWLSGETVEVLLTEDGLVQISQRGVLLATHARRLPPDRGLKEIHLRSRSREPKPPTAGVPVLRKVDGAGDVSFAGARYAVGLRYRGETFEVRVVGDSVQISKDGTLFRTHKAKHDPSKEHGAFAVPGGRPPKNRKETEANCSGVTQVPELRCKTGTGT